jgi:hypothetical protein
MVQLRRFFCATCLPHTKLQRGRVAEWLMAPVLKTGVPERVSGVRIPPLPPFSLESIIAGDIPVRFRVFGRISPVFSKLGRREKPSSNKPFEAHIASSPNELDPVKMGIGGSATFWSLKPTANPSKACKSSARAHHGHHPRSRQAVDRGISTPATSRPCSPVSSESGLVKRLKNIDCYSPGLQIAEDWSADSVIFEAVECAPA